MGVALCNPNGTPMVGPGGEWLSGPALPVAITALSSMCVEDDAGFSLNKTEISARIQLLGAWRNKPATAQLLFNAAAQPETTWQDLANAGNFGPNGIVKWLVDNGIKPILCLPLAPGDNPGMPGFKAMIAGTYDAHITTLATKLKNIGATDCVLRIGWEMNSDRSLPWCVDFDRVGSAGRAASDGASYSNYIAAWRRCVTRFRAILPNAIIDWCVLKGTKYQIPDPNNPGKSISIFYDPDLIWPGNDYVDVIGVDIYDANPYANPGNNADQKEANYQDWKNRTQNGFPYGIMRWRDWSNEHGAKPISVDEWGLRRLETTNNQGGADNPTYIEFMKRAINEIGSQFAWESYFRIDKKVPAGYPKDTVHSLCYVNNQGVVVDKTPFAGFRGPMVGSEAANATGLATAKYKLLFGGDPPIERFRQAATLPGAEQVTTLTIGAGGGAGERSIYSLPLGNIEAGDILLAYGNVRFLTTFDAAVVPTVEMILATDAAAVTGARVTELTGRNILEPGLAKDCQPQAAVILPAALNSARLNLTAFAASTQNQGSAIGVASDGGLSALLIRAEGTVDPVVTHHKSAANPAGTLPIGSNSDTAAKIVIATVPLGDLEIGDILIIKGMCEVVTAEAIRTAILGQIVLSTDPNISTGIAMGRITGRDLATRPFTRDFHTFTWAHKVTAAIATAHLNMWLQASGASNAGKTIAVTAGATELKCTRIRQ